MSFSDYYCQFNDDILAIEQLARIETENQSYLDRLLYANTITLMESYLMNTFRLAISNNDSFRNKFIETHKKFKTEKIKVSNIYEKLTNIDTDISKLSFHSYDNIKTYLSVISPEINIGRLSLIFTACNKRHDIVHRNGKNKRGEVVQLTNQNLTELIIEMKSFIKKLHNSFIS